MSKYKEGQEVCVSVKTLYESNEKLEYGTIVPDYDENGNMNYWDLYNEDGELACMDGETCIIEQVGNVLLTLTNDNGEGTIHFTITKEEADRAIFILETA